MKLSIQAILEDSENPLWRLGATLSYLNAGVDRVRRRAIASGAGYEAVRERQPLLRHRQSVVARDFPLFRHLPSELRKQVWHHQTSPRPYYVIMGWKSNFPLTIESCILNNIEMRHCT